MNNDHHHHHHLHQNQPPNSNRRVMKQEENTNQIQPPSAQKCPRCDSMNTKFCYYNNYSLSQPRYFCKACRRYWTHGGNLRNVPVGGGCRKSKRPKPSSSTSSANIDQISRPNIQSLSASSLPSSSAAVASSPGFLSQGFTGLLSHSALHQNIRATNPLLGGNNNIPSLYPSSSTVGGFFSSLGMVIPPQPLPQQGGLVSGNDQFVGLGANMALFQGMNLQNLKPDQVSTRQQMMIRDDHHRTFMNSWTQGFINSTGAASTGTSTPTTGFWIGGSANNVGDNRADQAGTSSSNLNQWSDNNNNNNDDDNNQGFDPCR